MLSTQYPNVPRQLNFGNNMLVMSKTHHVSELMDLSNPLCITLSHTLKLTAGGFQINPEAPISGLSCYGIGGIDGNIPRSCPSSYDKDGMFPTLQVHGQWSFVWSIGGEEALLPVTASRYLLDMVLIHVNSVQSHQERPMDTNICYFSIALPCIQHSMDMVLLST